jgi:hypothetical protein
MTKAKDKRTLTLWTPPLLEDLKRLYYLGISGPDIAKELNRLYGLSLTRNAISGKCQKLGFTNESRGLPPHVSKNKKEVQEPIEVVQEQPIAVETPKPSKPKLVAVLDEEPEPLGPMNPEEPPRTGCRFIRGDTNNKDWQYCGHDRYHPRTAYCGYHHRKTHKAA